MRKRARRTVFAVTAASLVAAGAAAGGLSGGGSPAPRAIALAAAGQQVAVPGISPGCPVLRKGYHGDCAGQLQAELHAYLDPALVVDNDFGEATRQAVIAFQNEQHLVPADGVVGPVTKAALAAVATAPPGSPQSPATPAVPTTPGNTSTPVTPGTPAGRMTYVALGDSYSAGEGLDQDGNYLPAAPLAPDSCDRSEKAYSNYVTPKPDRFIACSGQTIAGLTDDINATDSPVNANAGLITLTIGGNDLDWTGAVKACYRVELSVLHTKLIQDKAKCDRQLAVVTASLESLPDRLAETYEQLLQQAPNAQIRVLTYPPLFPDRGNSSSACRIERVGPAQVVIPAGIERQFVDLEQQANQAIMTAVQTAQAAVPNGSRLQSVDVVSQFGGYGDTGHTVSCGATGRPTSWVNAVRRYADQEAVLALDAKDGRWDQLGQDWENTLSPASFHPTQEGQHEMYLALQPTLPGGWS